ncbi:hypothetical protein NEF87_002082 [Candidatus Lokiarchaeum ossiferum]|uniref:ArsR family transcriptional regulator n=1 Tax=Candidatus Lokiarchaeum ossiferum TaxID=2951803 RepID=A0ABY6HQN1_9ARCH|nr:hypothetical protein NEF87_002082 [Candidatus Lokiarchaeum sp. B-35]
MNKFQDLLTYEQKAVQILTKTELNLLLDTNYSMIFKFLRNSPKTIEEIMEIFKETPSPKSKKTLYRYLSFLTKKGLINIAGKRVVVHPDQKLSSFNLYIRSAKFYLSHKHISNDTRTDPEVKQIITQYSTGMQCFLEILLKTEFQSTRFLEQMTNLIIKKENALMELLQTIPIEKLEKIKNIEYLELNRVLESVLWVNMIYNTPDIHEKVIKLLQKTE